MLDFNLLSTELNIDAARWTTDFHQTIRRVLEEHIGSGWRIIKITERSTTSYMSTYNTSLLPYPDYTLAEATATFDVELIENKPRDIQLPTGERLQVALERTHLTVQMISNGKLLITNMQMDIPR